MSRTAYVWVDLEFPAETREYMGGWKQAALGSATFSDWGDFGTSPIEPGFETVNAVLAQAARYVARERMEGRAVVFSVALGPAQVKIRAALDESQARWWHVLAQMARIAGPFDATGEFGWAVRGEAGWEGYVARVGQGKSEFARLDEVESRRLERHAAVVEIERMRAQAAASPPKPLTFQAPPPRPPGSRWRRRRGFRPRPVREEPAFGAEGIADEAGAADDLAAGHVADDLGGEAEPDDVVPHADALPGLDDLPAGEDLGDVGDAAEAAPPDHEVDDDLGGGEDEFETGAGGSRGGDRAARPSRLRGQGRDLAAKLAAMPNEDILALLDAVIAGPAGKGDGAAEGAGNPVESEPGAAGADRPAAARGRRGSGKATRAAPASGSRGGKKAAASKGASKGDKAPAKGDAEPSPGLDADGAGPAGRPRRGRPKKDGG